MESLALAIHSFAAYTRGAGARWRSGMGSRLSQLSLFLHFLSILRFIPGMTHAGSGIHICYSDCLSLFRDNPYTSTWLCLTLVLMVQFADDQCMPLLFAGPRVGLAVAHNTMRHKSIVTGITLSMGSLTHPPLKKCHLVSFSTW